MSGEGWTGIVNWSAGLIRCPDHGVQKLVPASELDDCKDCEVCVRETRSRRIMNGNLRERITDALDESTSGCARCKTCDKQVDAVMAVVWPEIVDRVRLARRRATLERMEDTGVPEIIITQQRLMVLETEEKLGLHDPQLRGPGDPPDPRRKS